MTERDVPDDLMKVAREVSQEIEDTATYGWEAGLDHFASVPIIARALAAERERATLAERERMLKQHVVQVDNTEYFTDAELAAMARRP